MEQMRRMNRSILHSILGCFCDTNLVRTRISVGVAFCQHLMDNNFVLDTSPFAGLVSSRSLDLGDRVTARGVCSDILSWLQWHPRSGRWYRLGMSCHRRLTLFGILDVVYWAAARGFGPQELSFSRNEALSIQLGCRSSGSQQRWGSSGEVIVVTVSVDFRRPAQDSTIFASEIYNQQ